MSETNFRDPEALGRSLLPWLYAHLPDADDIELPTPTKPEIGGSSETFFISPIMHRQGTRRQEHWVLRVEAAQYQVYKDPEVERQFRVMQVLHQRGDVPVPQPLWYEASRDVLGVPFYLMQRVEGRALPTMHTMHGLLAEAAPAARERMWRSSIEMLARIHCIEDDRLNFLARPELGATGLDQELAYWGSYRQWSQAPTHPQQDRAFRWLHDNLPAQRGTGLAWGDARPGNMIYQNDEVQAVIDWETVSLGTAETDLGWWLFYDWNVSDGIGIPRLEGFGGPAETIALWQELAGRQALDMEWHEIFATLRFSLIWSRARMLAERLDRPDAVPAEGGAVITGRLASLLAG